MGEQATLAAENVFLMDDLRQALVALEAAQRRLLADPLGITLFRVFQEAVSNAVKHAGVVEVWTYFRLEDGRYELRVWDDGRGFVVPERLDVLALRGHFGLVTVRERMASVGGHLKVRSAPGEGTEVRVWGQVENDQ